SNLPPAWRPRPLPRSASRQVRVRSRSHAPTPRGDFNMLPRSVGIFSGRRKRGRILSLPNEELDLGPRPCLRVAPRVPEVDLAVGPDRPDLVLLASPAEPVAQTVVDDLGRNDVRVEHDPGDRSRPEGLDPDRTSAPRRALDLDRDLPTALAGLLEDPAAGAEPLAFRPSLHLLELGTERLRNRKIRDVGAVVRDSGRDHAPERRPERRVIEAAGRDQVIVAVETPFELALVRDADPVAVRAELRIVDGVYQLDLRLVEEVDPAVVHLPHEDARGVLLQPPPYR